ncbi:MAG: TetR family transcriptional regulator [Hyphomicrobiaceae bacterium]|nr:TetR family transcriptional regulator [Hyphomicrobiaceae bacterium]
MFDQSHLRGRIVAATMKLASERPWRDVTLLDIAEATGVTLVDLKNEFATKSEILAAFTRSVDDEVLRRAPRRESATSPRDAIFEILMTRFDVLAPYKEALRSIAGGSRAPDPAFVCTFLASQHWMLQAAGIDTSGVRGGMKVSGLAGVYASVLRTWLKDDDPGLARTMAALDRRLRRGERAMSNVEDVKAGLRRIAEMFASVCRPRRRPSDVSPESGTPRAEETSGSGI